MTGETDYLVIGGSGLVGRALQSVVLENHREDGFEFTYRSGSGRMSEGVRSVAVDLARPFPRSLAGRYSTAIYLAGNSDHGLARDDPAADLQQNVSNFLAFVKSFQGSLVLLSSQAVYYDLSGVVSEDIAHVPAMPYGLSKHVQEEYAKYFVRSGHLSRVWIVRLMYAFGDGERPSRLIPSCARAAKGGGKVAIVGGGKSYLNPLPARFVARVLFEIARRQRGVGDKLTVTNLNHPERITTIDVVRHLKGLARFDFSVSGKELWPVRFWGDTRRISGYLKDVGLDWPNAWDEINTYFQRLTTSGVEA